jgi:protein TonB
VLRRRIQAQVVYPWIARQRGIEGVVDLELRLDASGRLLDVASVGAPAPEPLRGSAMQAAREATPLPFPASLVPRPLTIRLSIVFRLE